MGSSRERPFDVDASLCADFGRAGDGLEVPTLDRSIILCPITFCETGAGERGTSSLFATGRDDNGLELSVGWETIDTSGVLSKEWCTACWSIALRQLSSTTSYAIDTLGFWPGGRWLARTSAPSDSSTPRPCSADACTGKGYEGDGRGMSTASVGSMTCKSVVGADLWEPCSARTPRVLISCSACFAAAEMSCIFSRTTTTRPRAGGTPLDEIGGRPEAAAEA